MPTPGDDLRATGESIHRDAKRIEQLEEKKAELDPADPEVDELSRKADHLATELKDKASAEREISEDIQTSQ